MHIHIYMYIHVYTYIFTLVIESCKDTTPSKRVQLLEAHTPSVFLEHICWHFVHGFARHRLGPYFLHMFHEVFVNERCRSPNA